MSVTTNPPYISKVKLPGSNTVYEIKDTYARDMINTLKGSAINYRGKTKSSIYDGCSEANIQLYTIEYGAEIDGVPQIEETYTNYTAVRGDIVIQDKKSDNTPINPPIEYIWDGEVWQKFGSANEFGAFAYCDFGSVTITPKGTISTPTFTGTAVRLVTGNIAVPKTYTSTFSNGAANGSSQYTPAGTITTTTATTENKTTTVSAATSGSVTYTPQGTVSKPNITILSQGLSTNLRDTYIPYNFRIIEDSALSTMSGYQETQGSQDYSSISPENRYDMQTKFPDIATVNNEETLVFKSVYYMTMSSLTGDNGTSNSNGTNHGNITVKTADGSYQLETAPTFTGTGKRLVTGNIAVPKTYTSSFTGTEATISIESTVTGTVTTTTATTENKTATVSAASSGTTTYTPTGTITTPTFTGIEETYAVVAVAP